MSRRFRRNAKPLKSLQKERTGIPGFDEITRGGVPAGRPTHGFEFLSKLREIPGNADLPAVALTGFGRPEDIQRARENGFYAHLTKPFDIHSLATLLQKVPRMKAAQNM